MGDLEAMGVSAGVGMTGVVVPSRYSLSISGASSFLSILGLALVSLLLVSESFLSRDDVSEFFRCLDVSEFFRCLDVSEFFRSRGCVMFVKTPPKLKHTILFSQENRLCILTFNSIQQ